MDVSQDTGDTECRCVWACVPDMLRSRAGVGSLHAERCDEDIDDDDDEDEGRGDVFQDVQLKVLALVVQIPLH